MSSTKDSTERPAMTEIVKKAIFNGVNPETNSKGFYAWLLLTAIVCGALIMVVEVMGSRVVGPFFGVSLFIWTSLITVTLLALAVGYSVGGLIADRYESPGYMYGLILLASIFVLLVPVLKAPVLTLCVPMGLRGGAFMSTFLLFGPALFLLGCVSPWLVKIAARQMQNLGQVVGGLYALSTVGSTLGTVLTGFVLIAFLGVDKIFLVTGIILITISVGYFILFEKRYVMVVFFILPAVLYQPVEIGEMTRKDGTAVKIVHKEESFYGEVKVVDYSFGPRHIRELLIDGMIQGGIDMTNQMSLYEYSYYIQYLAYMLNPEGKRCLVIGLGAGLIPQWFERQGVSCDIVEIDPAVVDVAQRYFNLNISGESNINDARYFLTTSKKKYDFIVLDAFNGDVTPSHLLSVEALSLLKDRLAPGGVVATNIIGSIRENTFMTASISRTLRSVFEYAEIYPTFDVEPNNGIGNLVIMSYNGKQRVLHPRLGQHKRFDIHPRLNAMMRNHFGTSFKFPEDTPAMVLTDDYNPVDFYDSWLRERIRRDLMKGMDWRVMLG